MCELQASCSSLALACSRCYKGSGHTHGFKQSTLQDWWKQALRSRNMPTMVPAASCGSGWILNLQHLPKPSIIGC